MVVPDIRDLEFLACSMENESSEMLLWAVHEGAVLYGFHGCCVDLLFDIAETVLQPLIAKNNSLDLVVLEELHEEADLEDLVVGIIEDLLLEGLVFGLFEDSAGVLAEVTNSRQMALAFGHFGSQVEADRSVAQLLVLILRALPQQVIEHVLGLREGGEAEVEFLHQLLENLANDRVDLEGLHEHEAVGSLLKRLEVSGSVDEVGIAKAFRLNSVYASSWMEVAAAA